MRGLCKWIAGALAVLGFAALCQKEYAMANSCALLGVLWLFLSLAPSVAKPSTTTIEDAL